VAAIRLVLAATPFHGEGYRKIRARLAHRGLAIGGKRVLRLMRGHHLLAPRRLGPPNGDPAHAGTITTTRPDEMCGTDATPFYTEDDGWCWFFGAIDHCVARIGDILRAPVASNPKSARDVLREAAEHVAHALAQRLKRGPAIADLGGVPAHEFV